MSLACYVDHNRSEMSVHIHAYKYITVQGNFRYIFATQGSFNIFRHAIFAVGCCLPEECFFGNTSTALSCLPLTAFPIPKIACLTYIILEPLVAYLTLISVTKAVSQVELKIKSLRIALSRLILSSDCILSSHTELPNL